MCWKRGRGGGVWDQSVAVLHEWYSVPGSGLTATNGVLPVAVVRITREALVKFAHIRDVKH